MRFGEVGAADGLEEGHVAVFIVGLEVGKGESGFTVEEEKDGVGHGWLGVRGRLNALFFLDVYY